MVDPQVKVMNWDKLDLDSIREELAKGPWSLTWAAYNPGKERENKKVCDGLEVKSE